MRKVVVLALLVVVVGGGWNQVFADPDLGKAMEDFGESLSGFGQAVYDRQNRFEAMGYGYGTLISFRDAGPVLTEDERLFAVRRGYYCTANPTGFFIASESVSADAFLESLGYASYIEEKRHAETMATIYGGASLAFGVSCIAYASSRPEHATIDLTTGALGVGALIGLIGVIVAEASGPAMPGFWDVSVEANIKTREMASR